MKKKLFIPNILLIQETIDKYGYDPRELSGVESHKLFVVSSCNSCDNILYQKYASVLRRHLENKKCMYCSNAENARKSAELMSKIMIDKVNNGTYKPPMLGKNHSEETKNKISELNKGNTWDKIYGVEKANFYRERNSKLYSGSGNPFYGKKHTIETKEKISKSLLSSPYLRRGKDCNFYGMKYWPNKNNFIYKDTQFKSNWEVLVAKYLDSLNINWIYEPKYFEIDDSSTYTPDFFLYDLNKWIEVKGYWYEDALIKFNKFKELYEDIIIEVWDSEKLKKLNLI